MDALLRNRCPPPSTAVSTVTEPPLHFALPSPPSGSHLAYVEEVPRGDAHDASDLRVDDAVLPAPRDHLQGQQLQGRGRNTGGGRGQTPCCRPLATISRASSCRDGRRSGGGQSGGAVGHKRAGHPPRAPASGEPPEVHPFLRPAPPHPTLTPRGGRTCCSLIWKRHSEKSYRPSTLWRTPSDACRVMQGGGGCRMPALRPCGQGTHVPHSHTCGTHDRVWTHHDMHACRHAGRNFPPCRTNPPLSPTGTVDLP